MNTQDFCTANNTSREWSKPHWTPCIPSFSGSTRHPFPPYSCPFSSVERISGWCTLRSHFDYCCEWTLLSKYDQRIKIEDLGEEWMSSTGGNGWCVHKFQKPFLSSNSNSLFSDKLKHAERKDDERLYRKREKSWKTKIWTKEKDSKKMTCSTTSLFTLNLDAKIMDFPLPTLSAIFALWTWCELSRKGEACNHQDPFIMKGSCYPLFWMIDHGSDLESRTADEQPPHLWCLSSLTISLPLFATSFKKVLICLGSEC